MIEQNPNGSIAIAWRSGTQLERMTYYDVTPAQAAAQFVELHPASAPDMLMALESYIKDSLRPHLFLAESILRPFQDSSLYRDYQDADEWRDDQFHDMLAAFDAMAKP